MSFQTMFYGKLIIGYLGQSLGKSSIYESRYLRVPIYVMHQLESMSYKLHHTKHKTAKVKITTSYIKSPEWKFLELIVSMKLWNLQLVNYFFCLGILILPGIIRCVYI